MGTVQVRDKFDRDFHVMENVKRECSPGMEPGGPTTELQTSLFFNCVLNKTKFFSSQIVKR